MTTATEYLAWCKERALGALGLNGDPAMVFMALSTDLDGHPSTRDMISWLPDDIKIAYTKNAENMRVFIDALPTLKVLPDFACCDFCGVAGTPRTWNQAPDLRMVWARANSVGPWSACGTCQALLDAGQLYDLAQYAYTKVFEKNNMTPPPWSSGRRKHRIRQMVETYKMITPARVTERSGR